jgi:hypothetical protein
MSQTSAHSIQFKLSLSTLQRYSVFSSGWNRHRDSAFIGPQVTEPATAPFFDRNCNRKLKTCMYVCSNLLRKSKNSYFLL